MGTPHVTTAQERDAADAVDRAQTHPSLTVTLTVTERVDGVVESGPG